MPELPEVETIRRELLAELAGRRLTKVEVYWPRTVVGPVSEFLGRVQGRLIDDIRRRGKFLIFDLGGGGIMAMHLRMSGVLSIVEAGIPVGPYDRAAFHLDDGRKLIFSDRRKFGRVRLVSDEAEVTGALGAEPLELGFSAAALQRLLQGRKAPVKALLLQQEIIAGIGNMYADEALFAAGIHPSARADKLTPADFKRLHRGIRKVLRSGIECCGASVDTYRRPDGQQGWAHTCFKVAHRRGGSCPACGAAIQRIVVRGRGSYFCPRCQPARGPALSVQPGE